MSNLITGSPPYHKCARCPFGVVSVEATDGRFFVHPECDGVWVNLPPDLALPRCNECRYIYMSEETREEVLKVVQELLAEHAAMMDLILQRFRLEQKERESR